MCTVPGGGKQTLFRLNHSPYVHPHDTSGKDVTAEDATRAGKGCNRARAAIKGSVREITSEKSF